MRRALLISLTLACVLLATLPLLAEEPEAPAPAPAPAPRADAATIQRLVADLGSSDFAKREEASRALLALGEKVRPALERTMKESDNMEARWRAEQILRRLDREGERPMGQRPDAPRPLAPPAPGTVPPPGSPPVPSPRPSGPDALDKTFEEMRRRLFDGFGPGGFGDFGPSSERLEAPGLRLDAEVFASMLVRVTLLDEEEPRMHVGRSLEDILQRRPELEKRAGMAELKKKWAAFKKANPRLFGPGFGVPKPGSGFRFSQSGQGVEVIHDGEGVTVRIRERGEDGEEKVTEVKGATLDEIKAKHPELREKLDRFSVSVQLGPVQIFRGGNRGDRRLPVPPVVTPGDRAPAVFGIRLIDPEPVLAVHLGLEPGHGALVTEVIPATQAALMGLKRYDVIVSVNGKPVTDHHEAAETLRKAGRERGPLALELIRRGQPLTLER